MNTAPSTAASPHAAPGVSGERRRITIDPATRLEGHAKIEIFLDEAGDVERAYLQIPELRGFEAFCAGRPAEDMPQITSRICGVCPTAHHLAATKALDDLYHVEPPPTAHKLRELIHHAFLVEDHALHVYLLGGPDFIVGPHAPASRRNVLGVLAQVGLETGQRVIGIRRRLRELVAYFGGKAIHPVFGVPGGVTKPLRAADLDGMRAVARDALDFAEFTVGVFHQVVLDNPDYVALIRSEAYTHRTYYMGLVDERNRAAFYDGTVRVVDPDGREYCRFAARISAAGNGGLPDYRAVIAEQVEPWSFMKFCHLRARGWRGFVEGPDSGVYAVAPLARLNVADGLTTPRAQAALEEYFSVLGGKPVHHTLANHWARVIELLHSAERLGEILDDPAITDPNVRQLPSAIPTSGIGIIEAPRGTLIHHYETDARGLITRANLVVATQNNAARIAMSVDRAAKALIKRGQVSDGLLNQIEMAFRAYDPCFGCATHALPGGLPLIAEVRAADGTLRQTVVRD